jgi:hypothetical protein
VFNKDRHTVKAILEQMKKGTPEACYQRAKAFKYSNIQNFEHPVILGQT